MRLPAFVKSVIVLITFLVCPAVASPAMAQGTLVFGVLPRYLPIVIFQRFSPLAQYLELETGILVEVDIPAGFDEHIAKVKDGRLDLCYQNPVVYTRVAGDVVPLALASKGNEGTRFRGIIIVRSDSGIESIEDLKGKSVSIASTQSAGGFFSQKDFLSKRGIDVLKDMMLSEAPENKQENVILDVFDKRTDAGFIRESALHRMDDAINPGEIRVLAHTSWLPNWIFASRRGLNPSVSKKIQEALLRLTAESPVLKAAQLNGFVKPDPRVLKTLEELVSGE